MAIEAGTTTTPLPGPSFGVARNESFSSGVSWGAILGGAFVAAALGVALLSLGTGLGFASASAWQEEGASAKTIGIGAIVWLIIVQVISAGLGGYVAGRLRTKWATVHTDEVAFRDTAHGFIVWAVGVVITSFVVASTAGSIAGTSAQVAGSAVSAVGSGAAAAAGQAAQSAAADPNAYFTDMLLRSEKPAPDANDAATRTELARIMGNAVRTGDLPQGDRAYVAQVISARTGMSPQEADKRINDVLAQAQQAKTKAEQAAREAADTARKAAATFAFASFLAMLIGAFCATLGAMLGGRHRDLVND
jgi:hypothetical protein